MRCIPLFIKRPVIDLINRLHGDRFYTTTLSNMGNVELPEQMRPYVEEVEFILGRQRGNSGAVSCAGYGGNLYLHFSRNIQEDAFERLFLGQAASLGIPAEVSHHVLA